MLNVVTIVDKGLYKVNNEDRALINNQFFDEIQFEVWLNESVGLFAIADGVGGCNAGEVAAEETLKMMAEVYPLQGKDYEATIYTAIQNSENHLFQLAEDNQQYSGMATTLTGLILDDNEIITFNLGNSRVYRYRNGLLRQLTHDDSIVQELLDGGILEHIEHAESNVKNIITKYISSTGKNFKPSIAKHEMVIQKQDIFCLSSDGIHDFVSIEEMETILSEEKSLMDKAITLVEMAKNHDEHDNICIILIEEVG